MPGTRKLGRPTAHRNAMLRGLVTLLLDKGQVETTLTRAKEVQSVAEKMITAAKKSYNYRESGDKANAYNQRRALYAYITRPEVVEKAVSNIAPNYTDRNGGYTRIMKLGPRRGDAAEMAILEFVESDEVVAARAKADAAAAEAPKAEEAKPEETKAEN